MKLKRIHIWAVTIVAVALCAAQLRSVGAADTAPTPSIKGLQLLGAASAVNATADAKFYTMLAESDDFAKKFHAAFHAKDKVQLASLMKQGGGYKGEIVVTEVVPDNYRICASVTVTVKYKGETASVTVQRCFGASK